MFFVPHSISVFFCCSCWCCCCCALSRCHFLRFQISLIIMYGVFLCGAFNAQKIVLFIFNTYSSTDERILSQIDMSRRVNRDHVCLWSVTHLLSRLDHISIIESLSAGESAILSLSWRTMHTRFGFRATTKCLPLSSLLSCLIVGDAAFVMWPWPFSRRESFPETRKWEFSSSNQKFDSSFLHDHFESWNSHFFPKSRASDSLVLVRN